MTEHSHMLKNEILTSYGSEGTTCRSESAPNRDMSHWLPIELTRRYLSRCQNTKITILVLSCIIGFIDETLMTIPVPILPNLFLGKCQSELAHMHYNMAETQYRDDHVCSEELSMDLQTLCTVDTEHDRWKIAFMIDGTNQVCWTAAFDDDVCMTSLHNLSRRTNQTLECFEIPLTADICREWEDCEKEINVKVGVILSSKFLMRILLSPLLAVLPKYTGFLPVYHVAVTTGAISCTVYALSSLFPYILTARLIHGISATLLTVGMGGLTNYAFREDDKQRGIAIGTMISFMALGSVVGPPFGGLVFYLLGNFAPYTIMASVYVLFLGVSLLLLTENSLDESIQNSSPFDVIELILDPYIAICTLGFIFAGCSVSIIESSLPHWMITVMSSPAWLQGIIYLPMAGVAVPFGIIAGFAGTTIPRWLMVLAGFLSIGSALVAIPLCRSPEVLILPMILLGAGFGTLDSTLSALICKFGHERHAGMYAASIVICGVAFSFGFALGPSIMGILINLIGFQWLITGLGCMVVPFALASLILRIGENTSCDEPELDKDSHDEAQKLLPESNPVDG
ncbi:synaptic vesicular amine transporter-like isoform X2 [Apostichopus japonicus]|uniref:synaptic vesicular amine transporter-like isoform X2 n=1 Tax=Stichopus japonicus TaxID=307972 RepID=UPI003AB275CB